MIGVVDNRLPFCRKAGNDARQKCLLWVIELDEDFFLSWPDGYLPHQVRLQGGDASSESYCYP